MKEKVNFKHKIGDWVYVVEYDDCGVPEDIGGYILLMFSDTHALLSPMLNDTSDPVELCDEHYSNYREYSEECDCIIVPLSEVFTKEEAEAKVAEAEEDFD